MMKTREQVLPAGPGWGLEISCTMKILGFHWWMRVPVPVTQEEEASPLESSVMSVVTELLCR
jgi:hypothetical protein